jgi:hypothetical protein
LASTERACSSLSPSKPSPEYALEEEVDIHAASDPLASEELFFIAALLPPLRWDRSQVAEGPASSSNVSLAALSNESKILLKLNIENMSLPTGLTCSEEKKTKLLAAALFVCTCGPSMWARYHVGLKREHRA